MPFQFDLGRHSELLLGCDNSCSFWLTTEIFITAAVFIRRTAHLYLQLLLSFQTTYWLWSKTIDCFYISFLFFEKYFWESFSRKFTINTKYKIIFGALLVYLDAFQEMFSSIFFACLETCFLPSVSKHDSLILLGRIAKIIAFLSTSALEQVHAIWLKSVSKFEKQSKTTWKSTVLKSNISQPWLYCWIQLKLTL